MWWHTPRNHISSFGETDRVHLNRRGRQFSRLLAAEVCASAVVMLDTPRSKVVWRVLATHSIRQFPLHFPSHASPCDTTFQLDSTAYISALRMICVKSNRHNSWPTVTDKIHRPHTHITVVTTRGLKPKCPLDKHGLEGSRKDMDPPILFTGLSKKMDGIWNRYNLKSTGRIYTFGVLKCSEKFKVLDLP